MSAPKKVTAIVGRIKVGTVVGGCRVVGYLGQGASASVWEARASGGRRVALKVQNHQGDELRQQKFLAAAKVLKALDHPNVVRVLDLGQHGEKLYTVLELAGDGSLAQLLGDVYDRHRARRPLHPMLALAIGIDVALGLAAAHSLGIVHRDVKPENILLADGGTGRMAKLTDFDDSKFARDLADVRESTTGELRATLEYLAPELLDRPSIRDDPRSDLYALGLVIYTMLSGRYAFVDVRHSPRQLKEAQCDRQPAPLAELGLPSQLDDVLEAALAKDRNERYSRAILFASALLGALRSLRTALAEGTLKVDQPEPPLDVPALEARYEMTRRAYSYLTRRRVERAKPPSEEPATDDTDDETTNPIGGLGDMHVGAPLKQGPTTQPLATYANQPQAPVPPESQNDAPSEPSDADDGAVTRPVGEYRDDPPSTPFRDAATRPVKGSRAAAPVAASCAPPADTSPMSTYLRGTLPSLDGRTRTAVEAALAALGPAIRGPLYVALAVAAPWAYARYLYHALFGPRIVRRCVAGGLVLGVVGLLVFIWLQRGPRESAALEPLPSAVTPQTASATAVAVPELAPSPAPPPSIVSPPVEPPPSSGLASAAPPATVAPTRPPQPPIPSPSPPPRAAPPLSAPPSPPPAPSPSSPPAAPPAAQPALSGSAAHRVFGVEN